MVELAAKLAKCGWTLRSGGADGADAAFEQGCGNGKKEIFLPTDPLPPQAFELAEKYHPMWNGLPPFVKKLHARNMQQIFGLNLDCQVQFVVCWTEDGCEHDSTRTKDTGGTGQAISAASLSNIPVFNLANPNRLLLLEDYCECKEMQYSDYP